MTYKFGSRAMIFDSHTLAVPSLRLIGLLPSDLRKFMIPESARIPMSQSEKDKATSLLERKCIADFPEWRNEIELLREGNWKAEIQSLSCEQHGFIAKYLRWKLVHGSYI